MNWSLFTVLILLTFQQFNIPADLGASYLVPEDEPPRKRKAEEPLNVSKDSLYCNRLFLKLWPVPALLVSI